MYKRSNARKWVCLFLVLLLMLCALPGSAGAPVPAQEEAPAADAGGAASSDETVVALRAQIDQLRAQQRLLDGEIAKQKEQVSGVWTQKNLMDSRIDLLAAEVACYDQILADYDRRMTEQETVWQTLNESYAADFDVLVIRLRQSYEEGMPGLLELFERSDSLLSLLIGLERKSDIEEYDRRLMESLEQKKIQINEISKALESLRSARHKAAAEQVERRQLLNAALQEGGSYLQSLTDNVDRFNYYIQQSQAGIQIADRLIADSLRTLEEKLAQQGEDWLLAEIAAKEALLKDRLMSDMENGSVQKGSEYFADGVRYLWPLALSSDQAPSVTASMGYYTYQVDGKVLTDYHGGVDLAADYGTAVPAAASGVVVATGYEEGYGNFVAIRHMDGSLTKYAHLGSILVKAGDPVLQGETVATAGCSGNSAGVGCHFELVINGAAVDPERHLIMPKV